MEQTPLTTTSPPTKQFPFLLFILAILVLFSLSSTAYLAYQNMQLLKQIAALKNIPTPSPTSPFTPTTYDECLKAPGSRLQESFPATCVTSDGKSFTEPLTDEQKKNLLPPEDASCQYKGKTYKSGEGVPSVDNCNSCSCDNGQVACTTMACL